MSEAAKVLLAGLSRWGYRVTGPRRAVAAALAEGAAHVTAEELFEELRRVGARASRASVYRSLAALEQAGLVRRVTVPDGPARFELAAGEDAAGDWHFICRRCGRVIDVAGTRLAVLQRAAGEQPGLAVADCQVRLFGLCDRCRDRCEEGEEGGRR
jgi:Fur family ferric uptake transcriptional regulator